MIAMASFQWTWPIFLAALTPALARKITFEAVPASTSLTTLTSTYAETVTSTITSLVPVTTVETQCTPSSSFYAIQCSNGVWSSAGNYWSEWCTTSSLEGPAFATLVEANVYACYLACSAYGTRCSAGIYNSRSMHCSLLSTVTGTASYSSSAYAAIEKYTTNPCEVTVTGVSTQTSTTTDVVDYTTTITSTITISTSPSSTVPVQTVSSSAVLSSVVVNTPSLGPSSSTPIASTPAVSSSPIASSSIGSSSPAALSSPIASSSIGSPSPLASSSPIVKSPTPTGLSRTPSLSPSRSASVPILSQSPSPSIISSLTSPGSVSGRIRSTSVHSHSSPASSVVASSIPVSHSTYSTIAISTPERSLSVPLSSPSLQASSPASAPGSSAATTPVSHSSSTPLLTPTTSNPAPPSISVSASVNPTETSLSTLAQSSTVTSASVPNTEHTAPPLSPPRLTTSTVFTTQVHTVTACPAWIKDCPVSEKTTYYTTETVAAYTTVCPVAEETTKPLSPPAAITNVHPGKPGEQFTTSIVYTTTAYPTKVCPSSIHHCSESEKTTTITTETVVAYTTVCPVASEETTTAAVGPVATEHSAGPSGEKFTTSSVYTTTTYPTTVCPSKLPHCAESQKTVSTITETVLAYVTVCPVTATEEVGKTSALATATGPASEGENSSTTEKSVLSSIQTSTANIPVYSALPGESAAIGDTTTSESSSLAAITGTKTFVTVAESTGASVPEVYTSKPAYSHGSGSNGTEAEGFGSKTSLTGFPHGGTESWSPIKTSQHTSSSFAVSYSTTEAASSSSSAAISHLSSTSAAPAAIFTGSASRGSAGSTLALCVLAVVGYFAF